jgi:uncharacterized protein (TIGR02996 family)
MALPPLDATGQALEAALAADPDDRAALLVYTDWLSEQADSRLQARGEFIRTQLELDEQGLGPDRRRQLRERERELIRAEETHSFDGELKRLLLEADPSAEWAYARGWLSRLHVRQLPASLGRTLASATCFRLLRELNVDARQEGEVLAVLARCPHLSNVRALRVQLQGARPGLTDFVARLPKVESLQLIGGDGGFVMGRVLTLPLPRLRSLRVVGARPNPLPALAANPPLARLQELYLSGSSDAEVRALANSPYLTSLRRLALTSGSAGDEGVRAIVESGLLSRLESLDLSFCHVRDGGARLLAACPDTARLESLRLSGNELTSAGIEALQRVPGVRLAVDRQRPAEVERPPRRRRRGN